MREYRLNSIQRTKSKMFPVSHAPGSHEILLPLSQEQVSTRIFKMAGPLTCQVDRRGRKHTNV